MAHTHECRRCGSSIDCSGDENDAGCWEGDNVGCPNELTEYATEAKQAAEATQRSDVPDLMKALEDSLADAKKALDARATPLAGSVRDVDGDPCPAARTPDLYPLTARCGNCSADIACADGTADWYHKRTGSGRCWPRTVA